MRTLRCVSILGFIFAITATLAGCAPSAASIQTAIAQTQAAGPTVTTEASATVVPKAQPSVTIAAAPTDTPHPFDASAVKMDPSIIDATQLGLSNGVPINSMPEIWPLRDVHAPEKQLSRQLLDANGDFGGWVSFLVYQKTPDADQALRVIQISVTANASANPVTVGDAGVYYNEAGWTGLATKRCHLVIHILIKKDLGSAVLESFVGSMLKAWEPAVCEPVHKTHHMLNMGRLV